MSGNKRLVYVMMKILKKCYEDVNITSFKVDIPSFQINHRKFFVPDEVCSGQISGGEEV